MTGSYGSQYKRNDSTLQGKIRQMASACLYIGNRLTFGYSYSYPGGKPKFVSYSIIGFHVRHFVDTVARIAPSVRSVA